MSFDNRAVDTIWMNGEFRDWQDAQIHVLSHVVNYGTGIFEGSRCYETDESRAIFRLESHIDRLFDSAAVLDIEIPYSKETLLEAAEELVRQNDLQSCYIRHNIIYGYHSLGLDTENVPIDTIIAAFPRETYLGEAGLTEGVEVEISPWRRMHSSQFPTQVKAVGTYVISALSKRHATANGYDEAILLDTEGNVAEGSGENVFVVNDGEIYTPGLDSSILPGITRDSIIQIAEDRGYDVTERRITTGQLYTADEVFFCGTAAEVTPVRSVDDVSIGDSTPGPVTTEMQKEFFRVVSGECESYDRWLRYV